MANKMQFMGKWAFFQGDKLLTLDERSNRLSMPEGCPFRPLPNQLFNVYGESYKEIIIQASNGKYLTYTGDSYMATEARTGTLYFMIDRRTGTFGLIDKGFTPSGKDTYYVNVDGYQVTRLPVSKPAPASTTLNLFDATPGLREIMRKKGVQRADLRHVDLSSMDFTTFDFTGCNLSYANLSHSVLDWAEFSGPKTNLTGANLSGAKMVNVRMTQTILQNANLSQARLQDAKFAEANLTGANLTGANLTGAILFGAILEGAILTGANLTRAWVQKARFDGADLTDTDFTQAKMEACSICRANLKHANLAMKDFTTMSLDQDTNFTSTILQSANFTNLNLQKIALTRADLTNAVLNGANLSGAEMSYVNLTNAKLCNKAQLQGASLSNAILKGADFTGAQLGAKQEAFSLELDLQKNLDDLQITDQLYANFQKNGCELSANAVIHCREEGTDWQIMDDDICYSITRVENLLTVWKYLDTANAAVLAGAYMPDAVFTNANLYAVNMAGISWYGTHARAEGADMEEVNLSHANLSSMNLQQARLYGATFDFANLIGADLRGTMLCPSITKKPVSFVSASLESVNFTQAHLINAILTNAAVSLNEGPFFALDSFYINDLNHQTISSALRNQFLQHGYPITSRASVITNTLGMTWTILNDGEKVYKRYRICKLGNQLYVYGSVIGVHLFDLPQNMAKDLDSQRVTNDLRNAFAEHGYTLLKQASIDRVLIKGKKWHMFNEESDPRKFQTGYVEFYIAHAGESLHVYALAMLISRVGDHQKLEKYRYYLSDTQLTVDWMDDSTTCPNGQKVEMYRKNPDRLTWEMMMTANTPPHPPQCVTAPDCQCHEE